MTPGDVLDAPLQEETRCLGIAAFAREPFGVLQQRARDLLGRAPVLTLLARTSVAPGQTPLGADQLAQDQKQDRCAADRDQGPEQVREDRRDPADEARQRLEPGWRLRLDE